jgi:hypothetical protein
MTSTGDHAEINHDAHHRTGGSGKPYSSHHPVPNIHKYEERQQERRRLEGGGEEYTDEDSKTERLKSFFHIGNHSKQSLPDRELFNSKNRNVENVKGTVNDELAHEDDDDTQGRGQQKQSGAQNEAGDRTDEVEEGKPRDTSEVAAGQSDPRAKRKAMKKRTTGGDREVTDPGK